MKSKIKISFALNNPIVRVLGSIGEYILVLFEVLRAVILRPPSKELIRNQCYSIGVLSLPVVIFTGFSTGMVIAAQSYFQLADKGLASATGLMVGKSMVVELGPVLTAFMVTGRVGSAMCAELGTMQVTEQIDAIKSMAVNPMRYLLAPRIIAGTLMMPILTIFSALTGILGGYIVAVYLYNMPSSTFLDPLPVHLTNFDILSGFAKSIIFGFFIVSISCYLGIKTRGGAAGVGKSTTRSVVISYSVILLGNFIITIGLNNAYPHIVNLLGYWL